MQIDFSQLKRDRFGKIEAPTLVLTNRHGRVLGPLFPYFNLKMELKFNELSSATFDLPAWYDGEETPIYRNVTGEKLLRIDPFGMFILSNPSTEGDGVKEIKSCTAYSLEYELASKNVFFAEGTYPLYDPTGSAESILDIALENARNWSIGHVASSLYSRYRTFSQTDMTALDFLMSQVQKAYGCVFVFDTYHRTIDVLDANDETSILPIYMSFDNMLLKATVNEIDDNMATRISVSGAEGISIRNVNPTGTNQIIHLGYALSQNELPEALAAKYIDWKNTIAAEQAYYTGLVARRNSVSAQFLAEKARLTDLEGELTSLDNLRSVNTQGLAMASRDGSEAEEGTKKYFEERLKEIAQQYRSKEDEIEAQKELLEELQTTYEGIGADIQTVNKRLKMESYFTVDELNILDHYMIDGVFEDTTFAGFDVDVSGRSDTFTKASAATLGVKNAAVVDIATTGTWECQDCHTAFTYTGTPDKCPSCGSPLLRCTSNNQRRIFVLTGGEIEIVSESHTISAKLIHGTMDLASDGQLIFSAYLGAGTSGKESFPSANLSGVMHSAFDPDLFLGSLEQVVETTTDQETGVSRNDISYHGDGTIAVTSAAFYMTRNVTETQRYQVEQELYDYASDCIDELAYPTYEFEIESCNPLWDEELEPLKHLWQLGKGIYLQLNDSILLKPMILEIHLDFEKPENFSIIFSNEFQLQRPDKVNWLREIIKEAQATSRTLDTSKYEFGKLNTSGAYSAIENFLRNGQNAAYQQLVAGGNNDVLIDGSGITVRVPGSKEYIKISHGMIGLVDDESETSKMAMGHFYNNSTGTDFYGVLADIIGGVLLTGQDLVLNF